MKQKFPANAGLLSAVGGLIIVLAIYVIFGTVDLVFMSNDKQVDRMENVGILSEIVLPEGNLTYMDGETTKSLTSVDDLKVQIGMTLINNLFSFDRVEYDHQIDYVLIITINQ